MVLLLIVIAYFPFAWSPPRTVRNEVTRSADGSLQFGEMNYARTPGTPAWLQLARTSGIIQIQLEADPQSLQQQAPIMMLASDFWHTDFAIEQDHADLLVWLRRPGSDANGDPPFVLGGVLQAQRWNSVNVILQRGDLRIDVGGRTRLTEHVAADSPSTWSPGQIALGDEVHGGGPWQGKIRIAEVRTAGYAVDYVAPARCRSLSATFTSRTASSLSRPAVAWGGCTSFLRCCRSFRSASSSCGLEDRPCGQSPLPCSRRHWRSCWQPGSSSSTTRREVVADVVMQVIGALLGAVLASRLAHAKRSTAWLRRT